MPLLFRIEEDNKWITLIQNGTQKMDEYYMLINKLRLPAGYKDVILEIQSKLSGNNYENRIKNYFSIKNPDNPQPEITLISNEKTNKKWLH